MKINNYITLDSEKVYNNKEFKLFYNGHLSQSSSNDPIFIQYGNQDWKNIKTVQMKKDIDNKLYANIKLNNFDEMNFCFRQNDEWDNNSSNDYSFQLAKVDFDNFENNEIQLGQVLSDEFLVKYNLNAKATVNAHLSDLELENLREALDNLFPAEDKEKIKINTIQTQFADDFIPININDELEVYTPAMAYRQLFKAKVKALEENHYITNIALEEAVVLKPKAQYAAKLRELAKKNEVQQILNLASEDEAQFLVVSPYSEIDMFDNSLLGIIKRYAAYASKSMKKIYFYLKENFSMEDI